MSHDIHRVERFAIVGPYTLTLHFADGSRQRIDFRPALEGEMFGPLQDVTLFNAVELDQTFGTIQWPNGADFDPETSTTGRNIATNLSPWRAVGRRIVSLLIERLANIAMEPTARP